LNIDTRLKAVRPPKLKSLVRERNVCNLEAAAVLGIPCYHCFETIHCS